MTVVMKIIYSNEGTLVLRGQGWFLFAVQVIGVCATPIFVWWTIQLKFWDLLPIALIAPTGLALAYWRQYENWQLVLEADYGAGVLYSGRWLNRQRRNSFDLTRLQSAKVVSKEVAFRDHKGRHCTVTEHYLMLDIAGQHAPLNVAIGKYTQLRRFAWTINTWLDQNRTRMPRATSSDHIDSQTQPA